MDQAEACKRYVWWTALSAAVVVAACGCSRRTGEPASRPGPGDLPEPFENMSRSEFLRKATEDSLKTLDTMPKMFHGDLLATLNAQVARARLERGLNQEAPPLALGAIACATSKGDKWLLVIYALNPNREIVAYHFVFETETGKHVRIVHSWTLPYKDFQFVFMLGGVARIVEQDEILSKSREAASGEFVLISGGPGTAGPLPRRTRVMMAVADRQFGKSNFIPLYFMDANGGIFLEAGEGPGRAAE